MYKPKQIPIYTWSSWAIALLLMIIFTVDLYIRAPEPRSTLADGDQFNQENDIQSKSDKEINIEKANPKCCIATIFDSKSIRQTIALGYSLNNTGSLPPTMFAFYTLNKEEEERQQQENAADLSVVKQYFTVINISEDDIPNMSQLLFWSDHLKDYNPVVAVTHNGLFNRPPTKLCNSIPFSAVSKKGDVVYFETALMVIDPLKRPTQSTEDKTQFSKFINNKIFDWNPLSTDLSVDDFNNEYIDFWLQYSSPTFIHFDDDTFERAVEGNEKTNGSPGLYKIISKLVAEAKKLHADVFTK